MDSKEHLTMWLYGKCELYDMNRKNIHGLIGDTDYFRVDNLSGICLIESDKILVPVFQCCKKKIN